MSRKKYLAKQQRIGVRLTLRDGQGPHGSQRPRHTNGYSGAQIERWERGRATLYRPS